MNHARLKNQSIAIEKLVALLSQLQSEQVASQVTHTDGNDILTLIMNEVNALKQNLQAQATTDMFLTLSPDLLCIAGPDAAFQKANPSFMRVLGYSEYDLLSQTFLNFIHPEDVTEAHKVFERLAGGETNISFENRYRAKDDSYRTMTWTASPDSKTGCLYLVGRDITQQRQTEIDTKLTVKRLQDAEFIAKLGFWDLNLETRQGEWSKGHLALFGLQSLSSAPTFEVFIELVHPEDRIKVQKEFARVIEEKARRFEIEFRILIENGKTIRWMKEYGTLELSDDGKPLRISGSIQDVTQSKLAEIALNETLKNLNSTTQILERTSQMAKVGGWELDLSSGKVHLTQEAQRIHEIDDNYVPPLYSTGAEWYPPESWPIVHTAVQAAIEIGKPYDLESRFITAKGRTIWVRIQGFPVVVAGKVTHLQGTFQDITERKEKESENKFVGDAMGFGIWKFDPVTKAIEWDDRMYALYSLDPKKFSGAYSAWENMLSPETKEATIKDLELALKGEKEFNTEFEIKLKNGEVRHIAGRGIVQRNDKGEPVKMYGLNWDVSNRVRAESQLKSANLRVIRTSKLASLGEMAAGIAHEINNPLAIIHGGLRALPKFAHDPDQMAKKLQKIQVATERVAKIVKSLKKFSRTEEKSVYLPHSLSSIVKEAVILTFAHAQQNSTQVQTEFRSDGFTLCDEIEIEQVMINLINNGIDAAKESLDKWVRIEVSEDASSIFIRVWDSGPGIAAKAKDKLFQPFFTTKPVGQGTGLGLSIVKGILDEHQASIDVVPGETNTCFELRFKKTGEKTNVA